ACITYSGVATKNGRTIQRKELLRLSPAIPRGLCETRSIVPIDPHPALRLLSEGNARIDVAVQRATGRRRHALIIAAVRALAGDTDAPALEAVGIVIRRRRRAARHRGDCRRRQRQYC